jgi:hypothetical protein
VAEYIIEIRLAGYSREYVRGVIYAAARRFALKGVTRQNAAPRIILLGPIECRDERRIIKALIDAASKHKVVSYKLKGFSHYRGERKWLIFNQQMNSIYLDLEPSRELIQIRRDMESALARPHLISQAPHDERFYADIPFGDLGEKFEKVWAYIKEREDPNLLQRLLRITLVKGGRVVCEYDLLENKLSLRERSMSRRYLEKTMDFLTRSKADLKLMVLPKRPRTSRQTTLTGDERRPWLARIITPVLNDVRRNPQNWMPKMIMPIISTKSEHYRQSTLPADEPQGRQTPRMPPLFREKAKTYAQTTLAPQNARPWIAGIILPVTTKGKR